MFIGFFFHSVSRDTVATTKLQWSQSDFTQLSLLFILFDFEAQLKLQHFPCLILK